MGDVREQVEGSVDLFSRQIVYRLQFENRFLRCLGVAAVAG